MPIDYAAFGYAVSVAGGGIMGYVKSSKANNYILFLIKYIIYKE